MAAPTLLSLELLDQVARVTVRLTAASASDWVAPGLYLVAYPASQAIPAVADIAEGTVENGEHVSVSIAPNLDTDGYFRTTLSGFVETQTFCGTESWTHVIDIDLPPIQDMASHSIAVVWEDDGTYSNRLLIAGWQPIAWEDLEETDTVWSSESVDSSTWTTIPDTQVSWTTI